MGMAYFALIISGERKEASKKLSFEKDSTVISRLLVTMKSLGIEAFL